MITPYYWGWTALSTSPALACCFQTLCRVSLSTYYYFSQVTGEETETQEDEDLPNNWSTVVRKC